MGAIFACLAGVVLGLHFSVLVLIPVTVLGAMTYMAASWLFGHGLFVQLGHLAILATSLQAGYFVGLTGREVYTGLIARFRPTTTKRI